MRCCWVWNVGHSPPANTRFIIANSQRGMEENVRHFNVPANRVVVVFDGVLVHRVPSVDMRKVENPGIPRNRPGLRRYLRRGKREAFQGNQRVGSLATS